ncbi:hypothetical protein H4Q26_000029 [Puccinia striiformis f. sp. tritici PST-130]|nr:hypothetical protein H4Q26_000029 [Puccinia striiformis f. sp. tritici PST-130]
MGRARPALDLSQGQADKCADSRKAGNDWEDQVRVALEKTDTDNQQKKMTEFLDNEEVLESYRVRMACNVSQGEQDVSVRAEKEPVITTDSGNRLGTRLKEKIMGAINCRKNPVEKAIKLFNERRQTTCRRWTHRDFCYPRIKT